MTIDELDKHLCEKYPRLFKDRYKSPMESCLSFGLECGPGWGNLLNALCSNIQHHIDQSRKQRLSALLYNRALAKAVAGDPSSMYRYFQGNTEQIADWAKKSADSAISKNELRFVPNACSQVTINQIKEKFGTLRFYYSGGDDQVFGMVRMAESVSAYTCEECGDIGKLSSNGWMSVRCKKHTKK